MSDIHSIIRKFERLLFTPVKSNNNAIQKENRQKIATITYNHEKETVTVQRIKNIEKQR